MGSNSYNNIYSNYEKCRIAELLFGINNNNTIL